MKPMTDKQLKRIADQHVPDHLKGKGRVLPATPAEPRNEGQRPLPKNSVPPQLPEKPRKSHPEPEAAKDLPCTVEVLNVRAGVVRIVIEDLNKPGIFHTVAVDVNARQVAGLAWGQSDLQAARCVRVPTRLTPSDWEPVPTPMDTPAPTPAKELPPLVSLTEAQRKVLALAHDAALQALAQGASSEDVVQIHAGHFVTTRGIRFRINPSTLSSLASLGFCQHHPPYLDNPSSASFPVGELSHERFKGAPAFRC